MQKIFNFFKGKLAIIFLTIAIIFGIYSGILGKTVKNLNFELSQKESALQVSQLSQNVLRIEIESLKSQINKYIKLADEHKKDADEAYRNVREWQIKYNVIKNKWEDAPKECEAALNWIINEIQKN